MKFSILIPNFGFNERLIECFNSVSNQLIKGDYDYEVIVCDQSDKTTFQKIEEIVNKDFAKRINLIHSDVKGLLLARHTLMAASNGDYVCFVDSDDYIDNNYLFVIYNELVKREWPDLIIFGFQKESNGHNYLVQYPDDILEHIDDYFCYSNCLNSVSTKCFKKQLYSRKEYNDFQVTNGEDWVFSFPLFTATDRKVFVPNIAIYHYVFNSESMTNIFSVETGMKQLSFKYNNLKTIKTLNKYQSSIFIRSQVETYIDVACKLIKNKTAKFSQIKIINSSFVSDLQNFDPFICKDKLKKKHKFVLFMLRHKHYRLLYISFKLYIMFFIK